MPLPLAMMIPFMGIQSAVMAKQFGENFQYGKRRISAMSNEEFNKLTPKILNENANEELKSMIPSMEASITNMREFQTFLIREFINVIQQSLAGGLDELMHTFGVKEHLFPHGDTPLEPLPPPPTLPPPPNLPPPPEIGGTPQPPVEVPKPVPPPVELKTLTKALILAFSVGKIRKGMSYNVWYYSFWTKNPNWEAGPTEGWKWTKISAQRGFTSLAKLRDWINKFLLPKDYRMFKIGIDTWYYVPNKFLVGYKL